VVEEDEKDDYHTVKAWACSYFSETEWERAGKLEVPVTARSNFP